MMTPSHFTCIRDEKDLSQNVYLGKLQHKDCGTVINAELQAETFSQMVLGLSMQCPNCKKYGGPANWNSLPLGVTNDRNL